MKFPKLLFSAALLLLALVLMPAAAKADNLTITLVNPNRTAAPGATLSFIGNLTNGVGAISLDGINAVVTGGGFVINTAPFFTNAPLTLASNASTGNIELFRVTVPAVFTTTGVGTVTVFYTGVNNVPLVSTASFSISNPIPEPATMILLGTGLAGVAAARRRRRKLDDR